MRPLSNTWSGGLLRPDTMYSLCLISCSPSLLWPSQILFVSPEKVLTPGFQRFMVSSLPAPGVSFACIDEAHCVSEWSHCFRPTYLRLTRVLLDVLKAKAILALTATATNQTQADLCRALHIPPSQVRIASIERTNLLLTVSADHDKLSSLVQLLLSPLYTRLKSIIVYVSTQANAEIVAASLSGRGILADAYHAGFTSHHRTMVQQRFMSGKVRVIVATVAFGMGLDKQDVRAVIHYNLPRSIEHYVQEIGRAGRDGKAALCHTFYSEDDVLRLKSQAHSNGLDRVPVKNLFVRVFGGMADTKVGNLVAIPLGNTVEQLDMAEEMVETLLTQLELVDWRVLEEIVDTLETNRAQTPVACRHCATGQTAQQTNPVSGILGARQGNGSEHGIQCYVRDTSLFSGRNAYARIVSTMHNRVKVGFTRVDPLEMAPSNPVIKEVLRQCGVDVENIDSEKEKLERKGSATHVSRGQGQGRSRSRVNNGRYEVDICEAANHLNLHVSDVQRELLRLRNDGYAVLEWEARSICVQVGRQPQLLDKLIDLVTHRMQHQEAVTLAKAEIASTVLRMVAVPTVTEALQLGHQLIKMQESESKAEMEQKSRGAHNDQRPHPLVSDTNDYQRGMVVYDAMTGEADSISGCDSEDESEGDEEDDCILQLVDDVEDHDSSTTGSTTVNDREQIQSHNKPGQNQVTTKTATAKEDINKLSSKQLDGSQSAPSHTSTSLLSYSTPLRLLLGYYFTSPDEQTFFNLLKKVQTTCSDLLCKSHRTQTPTTQGITSSPPSPHISQHFMTLIATIKNVIASALPPLSLPSTRLTSPQAEQKAVKTVAQPADSKDSSDVTNGLSTIPTKGLNGDNALDIKQQRELDLAIRAFVRLHALPMLEYRTQQLARKQRNNNSTKEMISDGGSGLMNARAVARILHGLPSPAYPAQHWSSNPYWGEFYRIPFEIVMARAQIVIAESLKAGASKTSTDDKSKMVAVRYNSSDDEEINNTSGSEDECDNELIRHVRATEGFDTSTRTVRTEAHQTSQTDIPQSKRRKVEENTPSNQNSKNGDEYEVRADHAEMRAEEDMILVEASDIE